MKHLDKILFFILINSVLSIASESSCFNYYNSTAYKKPSIDTTAIKIIKNKQTQKLIGKVLIRSATHEIQITEAASLWKKLAKQNAFSAITESSIILININDSNKTTNLPAVYFDAQKNLFRIDLNTSALKKIENDFIQLSLVPASLDFNQSLKIQKKIDNTIFVSGLVSMSAEPPEAFFAASTKAEMGEMGFKNATSDEAKTWVIRTADSRAESVFKFYYASEDRPLQTPYQDKFLVAVGLGPKNDPTSGGLKEADLIISGDEQKGVLSSLLSKLQNPELKLSDLDSYSGTAIKTNPREIVLNSLNYSWYLTKSGFGELKTDPNIFRKIISTEYDEYLSTLFKDGKNDRNKISYLLATSRGCTQGCAICCSGGLSPFQYFSADRIVAELQKIKQLHDKEKQIDIFFVDSNFNNNPERIIELADKINESGFANSFRFFVRHNTLNGFLNPSNTEVKTPNMALIEAYKKLGIKEIMMGIDSYDNASVTTLKSNRLQLNKKGIKLRPTYSYEEIAATIKAMNNKNLYTRGFLLSNNPFVSDLDRIDSYYNLFFLWANNPRFSIDARTREVIQLKPFDGSPVGNAAKLFPSLVKYGRFHTESKLGELDEHMAFLVFNRTAEEIGIKSGVDALLKQRNYIREQTFSLLAKFKDTDPFALAVLNKLKQRDEELLLYLKAQGSEYEPIIISLEKENKSLPNFPGDLTKFQENLFATYVQPLIESLNYEEKN